MSIQPRANTGRKSAHLGTFACSQEGTYRSIHPDPKAYSHLHKLTKTSVSGGGLSPGKTRDYAVTLEPGEYVFSCPLNTTPDYRLVVKGG